MKLTIKLELNDPSIANFRQAYELCHIFEMLTPCRASERIIGTLCQVFNACSNGNCSEDYTSKIVEYTIDLDEDNNTRNAS